MYIWGDFLAISEETEQFQGLASAIQKAKDLNDQVLFSHIKKVNCNNPFHFIKLEENGTRVNAFSGRTLQRK